MACWLGGNSEFARYISDGDNDDDDNDEGLTTGHSAVR